MDASDLPLDANAGGVRPACVDELIICMPVDLAVMSTGHDSRATSALYEYFRLSMSMLMAGARLLAGHAAPTWGQLAPGPLPASLQSAVSSGIMAVRETNSSVDCLFHFDSAAPPKLKIGGQLRPMVLASAASLIMHYLKCTSEGEMTRVQEALREA